MIKKPKIAGIRFIVTSNCNYNCSYCHNEWEPKRSPMSKINPKLIDSLIKGAKKLGGTEVDITGGEPLLEIDRVITILSSANQYNIWTNITTNGFYLNEYGQDLIDNGLKEMHIHISSLNNKKYHSIMKGNSNLERVLENIERFNGKLPKLMVNIPIEKGKNDNEILQFLNYFGNKGIIPRFIELMSTPSYISLNKIAIESLIEEKLGKIEQTGSYLWGINTYKIKNIPFEILRCICFDKKCLICHHHNFIHIDHDYKIRPCNLREYRINVTDKSAFSVLKKAFKFLESQKNIPEKYQKIWKK